MNTQATICTEEPPVLVCQILQMESNLKNLYELAESLESICHRLKDESNQKSAEGPGKPAMDYSVGHLGTIDRLIDANRSVNERIERLITKLNRTV